MKLPELGRQGHYNLTGDELCKVIKEFKEITMHFADSLEEVDDKTHIVKRASICLSEGIEAFFKPVYRK